VQGRQKVYFATNTVSVLHVYKLVADYEIVRTAHLTGHPYNLAHIVSLIFVTFRWKTSQRHITLIWRQKPHTAATAKLFVLQKERAYSL